MLTDLLEIWIQDKSDVEIEQLARVLYAKLYLTSGRYGVLQTHDGEKVIFHENAFDHAFYTSSKGPPYGMSKDKFDKERAARIRWIRELITGRAPNSACWEVIARGGRPMPPNRLYVSYQPAYLVWLEPRKDGTGWNFASAYPSTPAYVRERTTGGYCVWKSPK